MQTKTILTTLAAILMFGPQAICQGVRDQCVARAYTVVALPLIPAGINDSSEVVGTTASHKAALWTQQSGLREIDPPRGFTSSEGVAINNRGHIVGIAVDLPTNNRQGFVYSDGKLELLPGVRANPRKINDSDMIVGEAKVDNKPGSSAVSWKGSSVADLGGCCGGTSLGVNNRGQIVGDVYNEQGRYEAFLWDEGRGVQHIGPPNLFSSALVINDAGDVVVQSFSHGLLLYRDAKLTRLELSPKTASHPKAMSNCGVLVGSTGGFHDYYRAFVWDQAQGFHDLNDLIPPNSGWKLQEATSINNHGEIVGWGEHGRVEEADGFLLIPQH